MILSNEPGYYREGHFGIRIENLLVVQPAAPLPGSAKADSAAGRLAFEKGGNVVDAMIAVSFALGVVVYLLIYVVV
jgi:Xaa-Pro aminopeptidase